MTALLTGCTAPGTAASIPADELNGVLVRIRTRCRPDVAVSAAQRLEALLGLLESGRGDLQGARSGAAGWLGLGSVAFLQCLDAAEADAGRVGEVIGSGASALRTYADVAETCLERCRSMEHGLLVAYDDRSRQLAAEATADAQPPAGPRADQVFDSAAGDLLRAARLLLGELEAAIRALIARLSQPCAGRALPGDIATGPGVLPVGATGGSPFDWWGAVRDTKAGFGEAKIIWEGAKALSLFAGYLRAPQGLGQAIAAARYGAALAPFLGGAAVLSLPLTAIGDLREVIDPTHSGARGWGDRAAGFVGAAGATTLFLAATSMIALGPVGAAVAVGGLVVASGWQLGNLLYDHRKGIGQAVSGAWHGVEGAGNAVVHGVEGAGSAVVQGVEGAGSAVVQGVEGAGSAVVHGVEGAGSAVVQEVEGVGSAIKHGVKRLEGNVLSGFGLFS